MRGRSVTSDRRCRPRKPHLIPGQGLPSMTITAASANLVGQSGEVVGETPGRTRGRPGAGDPHWPLCAPRCGDARPRPIRRLRAHRVPKPPTADQRRLWLRRSRRARADDRRRARTRPSNAPPRERADQTSRRRRRCRPGPRRNSQPQLHHQPLRRHPESASVVASQICLRGRWPCIFRMCLNPAFLDRPTE